MTTLMDSIVVKQAERPAHARPSSAVYSRPQGLPVGKRPASAYNFGGNGGGGSGPAPVPVPASAASTPAGPSSGGPVAGRPTGQLRKSVKPPDGSRFPRDSAPFLTATATERADMAAGVGGTTLPGAQSLQQHHANHLVARAQAAEQKAQRRLLAVAKAREQAAEKAAMVVPASQRKFAWGHERISHALLSKFDQFTARQEDHTRKLLWTIGTDPNFKDHSQRNAIRLTPANFPHVCNRFGIHCEPNQAEQIFEHHGLPKEGCSVSRLSASFIDSKVDTANVVRDQARRMHGDVARPRGAIRPQTPVKQHSPYHHAFFIENAWKAHNGVEPDARPAAGRPLGRSPTKMLFAEPAAAPAPAATAPAPERPAIVPALSLS